MSTIFSLKTKKIIATEVVLLSVCIGLTLLFFAGCLMYNEYLKYSVRNDYDEISKIMVSKESKQKQLDALLQTIPIKYDLLHEEAGALKTARPSLPNHVRRSSLSKIFDDYKKSFGEDGTKAAGFPQTYQEYLNSVQDGARRIYRYAKESYTSGVPKTYADFLSSVDDQLPKEVSLRVTREALHFAAQKPGNQLSEHLMKLSFDENGKEIYKKSIAIKKDIDSFYEDIIDCKNHVKQSSLILSDIIIDWTTCFFIILLIVLYPCRLFVYALIWSVNVLRMKG